MVWQFVVLAVFCVQVVPSHQQWFNGCTKNIVMRVDQSTVITSDGYPGSGFPLGTNCQYNVVVPGTEYKIQAECQIELTGPISQCPTQRWYVNRDGNTDINTATYYCGTQTVYANSTAQNLMMAVIASKDSGRYRCEFKPVCDCGWRSTPKIVGGVNANPTEFPAMASLYNSGSQRHFCGASIMSSQYVLTAAHCIGIAPPNLLQVAAGIYNTAAPNQYNQFYRPGVIRIHPQYDRTSNDVALVQIQGRFQWNLLVAPACLPLFYPFYDFANTNVIATGWGTNEFGGKTPAILQKVTLQVLSNNACASNLWPSAGPNSTQICTFNRGRDTCQSDSGGPLWYVNPNPNVNGDANRLFNVGVVSFGEGCGGPKPGVNSRITSFMAWIESVTGPLCRRPM